MPARSWTACSRPADRRRRTEPQTIPLPTFHPLSQSLRSATAVSFTRSLLTEKAAALPRFPPCPQQLAAICCTNAALDFRRLGGPAGDPAKRKNDIADKMLRDSLP